jgi:hypothetical protein
MVNIDTVYQRVLALANKEQRGYITPLEFNLLANQAQMDIFEQYFYDLNQFALEKESGIEFSSTIDTLDEKIEIFQLSTVTDQTNIGAFFPSDMYKLGAIRLIISPAPGLNAVLIEHVSQDKFLKVLNSPLTTPSNNRPIYFRQGDLFIVWGDNKGILPPCTNCISINYIRQPNSVEWGYNVVVDEALYNSGKSTNFELHSSEQTKLVIKILELAGIVINKPGLVSIAAQKEASKVQQEKA